MKKRFSLLFLAILLVLSACGKEDASPEAKGNDEIGKSDTASEEKETNTDGEATEYAPLELTKTNVQVGNEPIPGDLEHLHVVKDGKYTYFIGNEADHTTFSVSVVKGNTWTEKEVKSKIQIDNPENEVLNDYITESGHSLLVELKRDYSEVVDYYKLTMNPSGKIDSKLIYKFEPEEFTSMRMDRIHGSDGKEYLYLMDTNDDSFTIYDDDGKEWAVFENKNDIDVPFITGFSNGTFLDVDKKMLYIAETTIPKAFKNIIDLKEGDFVWDESGQEVRYDLKRDTFYGLYKPYEDWMYDLSSDGHGHYSLSYSMMGQEGLVQVSTASIPEDLEFNNPTMIVGKKAINVYTEVTYKGKPTIQKYTFDRID
ncbi:hypothetical protein [Rossellomorea marisflavi]|uniref:hypothetical protein n=1 Tax=Rossellomorea marisflavi TaxID=189381 RepID=UPI00351323E2